MRILLVNDDGILAEGLHVLAKRLTSIGTVYVAAPNRPRSAASHGITLHKPLHLEEFDLGPSIHAFSVSGTPADCVKIGISTLMPGKPDLIISGINSGPNLGTEILYSGTVSAAAEGMINGVPSISVSQCGSDPFDYTNAADFIATLAPIVVKEGLNQGTLLNVNVPINPPKGVKLTKVGYKQYENRYEVRKDPRGKPYFWLAGGLLNLENPEGTDVAAVEQGYISVTAVKFQLDDHESRQMLEKWELFE